ncbi:unnamed protein product, partial [Rotaria magnacalcarata]
KQGASAGSRHQILLPSAEGAKQVLEMLKYAKDVSSCEEGATK